MPLHAHGDDYQNYQPQPTYENKVQFQPPPPPENKFIGWINDLLQGVLKGDAIEKPTTINIAGEIAAGLTPIAPVTFMRDFAVDSYKSAKTGFQSYKTEAALAAVGMVPFVGELRKLGTMYKMERETVLTERAMKSEGLLRSSDLVRKVLPPLKADYVAEFEEVRTRTFKAGDIIYRSPSQGVAEDAFNPGRWFGTRETATRTGTDSLYQTAKYGNEHSILRTYEFKQDVTVYYGRVKNGNGYQAYIPDDINPGSVLRWSGVKVLR